MNEAEITRRLVAGRNRSDFGHEIIQELGFQLSLWNGNPDESAGISVTCGGWATTSPNVFLAKLPDLTPATRQLYTKDTVLRLMFAVVEAWDPDWAVVSSMGIDAAAQHESADPFLGWITYLGADASIPLPANLSVAAQIDVPGKGQLIVARSSLSDVNSAFIRELASVTAHSRRRLD